MALANVLQGGPEEDPLRRAEIEILDDLYYAEAPRPGPGDIRINRSGRTIGRLTFQREHIHIAPEIPIIVDSRT